MLTEYGKFYYESLSECKKKIYVALYNGFKDKRKSVDIHVDISKISLDEIYEIIISVYNDTPSFYYLKVTSIYIAGIRNGYRVFPEYIYSDKQIAEYNRQLESGLQKFCEKYIQHGMSDYQKEITIHDFLVKTIKYDYEAENSDIPKIHEAYNVLGALLKRRAVCWGIACAFKLLCDYCQVKSLVVVGDTKPKESEVGHAWNMVKLDGETYHVDVTWDIKEKDDISFCYDYFNLNDQLIQLDHTWENSIYPKCASIKQNYYYKHRLFVKTASELSAYICSRLRANEHYIAVKYASAMPPEDEIEKAIRAGFRKALKIAGYRYFISEQTHNIYIEIDG